MSSPYFVDKYTYVQDNRTNKQKSPEENSHLQTLLFLPHQLKTWMNEFKKIVLVSGLNSQDVHPLTRTIFLHSAELSFHCLHIFQRLKGMAWGFRGEA